MDVVNECPAADTGRLTKNEFDQNSLRKLQKELANGRDLHLLSDAAAGLLVPMWPQDGGDNCPEQVLLEVEIISSQDEDSQDKTFLDMVAAQSLKSIESPGECSGYGSDSGTDQTSELDLSHNSLLSPPHHRLGHVHANSFDLPRTLPLDWSPAVQSGAQTLDFTNCVNAGSMQRIELMDVNRTETVYTTPMIKQEPGTVPQSIHNHIDYNSNVRYPPSTGAQCHPPYNIAHNLYPFHHANQLAYHSNHADLSNVKVEDIYTSSPCNIPTVVTSNIPNVVAPRDDEATDSGTESVYSRESDGGKSSKDKRRPGRKKGQVSKVYHLWEFIRDVLADPRYCPSVVKWENEPEGIFRVIQSEVMATMWGDKKNNRTPMTYEKMSRSIRYSRKEGYFADLPRNKGYPKKLCFKFGEKASGWSKNYS